MYVLGRRHRKRSPAVAVSHAEVRRLFEGEIGEGVGVRGVEGVGWLRGVEGQGCANLQCIIDALEGRQTDALGNTVSVHFCEESRVDE